MQPAMDAAGMAYAEADAAEKETLIMRLPAVRTIIVRPIRIFLSIYMNDCVMSLGVCGRCKENEV